MKYPILIILIFFSQCQNIFAQGTFNPKGKPFLEYTASIAGKTKGPITKEEILNAKSLLLDKDSLSTYHIISFKMTLACKGRVISEYDNQKNGELNLPMIEGIKNSEAGCKLFFEYIRVTDSSNLIDSMRPLRPLDFIIK